MSKKMAVTALVEFDHIAWPKQNDQMIMKG
jgi:hypothetical protein